jgi:hypothetical protein
MIWVADAHGRKEKIGFLEGKKESVTYEVSGVVWSMYVSAMHSRNSLWDGENVV